MFAVVADVTRMGEWSPECKRCRWVAPRPARRWVPTFEGDNVAALGPITLKKWTTTSEVTAYEQDRVFEFFAEGITTWRYELAEQTASPRSPSRSPTPPSPAPRASSTTRSCGGPTAMQKGMQQTLAKMKAAIEA